jgi:hypothetical protein
MPQCSAASVTKPGHDLSNVSKILLRAEFAAARALAARDRKDPETHCSATGSVTQSEFKVA